MNHQMKPVLLALTSVMLSALAGGAGAADTCLIDTTQADFQQAGTIATNVDTATSSGNVILSSSSGGGGTLDQQNTTFTVGLGERCSLIPDNNQWCGQTFTAGKSGSLSRIDLNMGCFGDGCAAALPSVIVSVRATSGGLPTGGDLAPVATFRLTTGTQTWYSANFTSPPTVTSGTKYAIVIRPSQRLADYSALVLSDTASKNAQGLVVGNDVYGGGAVVFSTTSGSSWTVEGQQAGGAAPSVDGAFKTYIGSGTGGGYNSSGDLISATKDSNPGTASTNWSTLSWHNTAPTGTTLKFQAAASDNSTGPFTFVGPDGTSGSFFTASGASLSQFNGNRYLKYRAYLSTGSSTATPTLNDAQACYSTAVANVNADLSITNTDGAATATPGTKVIYTVTASNAAGASTVTGATVTDTFPQPLANCSFTCVGSNGGTCPSSGVGNINSTVTLPGGASATFTATCNLPVSATGSLSNTASIAAPAGVNDTNPGNNQAIDTDTLTPSADLSITNSDALTTANPGQSVTYVIRAANATGPSNVTGALVTDNFPATLSCNWTCSGTGGGTCDASGSGSINDTVNLPKGGSVTYNAVCKIASAATGSVSNTATVAVPAGATDPGPSVNSATDTDSLIVRADAIVTMDDGVTSAQVGEAVDYVIQVTNAGPSDVSVTVSDTLPAQLKDGSWICSATGGASCAKSSGNNNTMNTSATVPVNGKATYIFTATVAIDNNVDAFTNVVSIGAPTGADPNGGNNVVRDTNTVVVYQSGFEPDPQTLAMNVASASSAGDYFAVQMGVDAGLLNHLGSKPVTIASGLAANGKKLFSVQLARLGADIVLRTQTNPGNGAPHDVSAWRTVDLKQYVLSLDWQSASARGHDGYLNVAAGSSQMSPSAHDVKEPATQLQIAVENDIPWLVPIAQ